MTLPRKQSITAENNGLFSTALRAARARPDYERARVLVEQAVERIQAHRGHGAYSWSGGKDSQVIAFLCHLAGANEGFAAMTYLEFDCIERWVARHVPDDCSIIRCPFDWEWLRAHPRFVFCKDQKMAAEWMNIEQWTVQRQQVRARGLDAMFLGRLRVEGNYCGKNGVYRDGAGCYRVSPIFDWSIEDVLNVIAVHRIPLPPCYLNWPRGWRFGPLPWPKRSASLEVGWTETYAIEPPIVERAAHDNIPGARQFMRSLSSLRSLS